MATIAVFIALGGASYAAMRLPKNSVGRRQLRKNAVTGAKVRDHSLTDRDILTSSLGLVPSAASAAHADRAATADTAGDAATLQGISAEAFVRGHGSVLAARRDLDVQAGQVPLIDLPGVVSVNAECTPGPFAGYSIRNTSGGNLDVVSSVSGVPPVYNVAPVGDFSAASTSGLQVIEMRMATRAATPTMATLHLYAKVEPPLGKACLISAQATISR